jgi:type II secretory ATPase GspE/PulE/Tfp pilus assembly ATPase PilB-like protein
LANSIEYTIGQRLARRICPDCKQEISVSPEELEKVKKILAGINNKEVAIPEKLSFYKGAGCEKCGQLGYKGRIGLYEAITMTPEIQTIIQNDKVTDFEIEQAAIKNGMVTILQDGIIKALNGETTLEEVYRVI